MAKTNFESITEYLATLPDDVRAVLQRVRTTLRKALPDADEAISYQIPTFKVGGRPVIYFAGWKEHCSLYPANGPLLAALKTELAPYRVSKGTIRFPLGEPVPVRLIARIAKLRAQEVADRVGVKPKKSEGPKRDRATAGTGSRKAAGEKDRKGAGKARRKTAGKVRRATIGRRSRTTRG